MSKKNYTFSLDEGLMNKAKEKIDNISGFFNECLEIYLHSNSDEFELEKISEDIRKLNLKRDLIVKMQLDDKYKDRDLVEEQNNAWSRIYNPYLASETYEWEDMKKAIELLGYSEETLVGMMDALKNNTGFDKHRTYNDWDYALNLFEDLE